MLALALTLLCLSLPQTQTGALSIRSEPDSEVFWEDFRIGVTDTEGVLEITEIPPGQYTVSVRKRGFKGTRRRIQIQIGHQIERFDLQPLSTEEAPEVSRPQPEVKADATPEQASGDSESRPPYLDPGLAVTRPEAEPVIPRFGGDSPEAPRPPMAEPESQLPLLGFLVLALVFFFVMFVLTRKSTQPEDRPADPRLSVTELLAFQKQEDDLSSAPSASFLRELRQRERMEEDGVEIILPKRKSPVIDLKAKTIPGSDD